jgi:lauroyl/myristoyl acyltransferase
MDLVKIGTSRFGPEIACILCMGLPRSISYQIGEWLAERMVHLEDDRLVETLRENLSVVLSLSKGSPEVDETVFHLLRNTMLGYIDLFCALQSKREAACMFEPDLELLLLLERCQKDNRGLVLVGMHSCGFDLQMLSLLEMLPSVHVLSNSNPEGSSIVMNKLRAEQGLLITPISSQALKQAVRTLCSGGVVALANDVPIEGGECLDFFGRSCTMPIGHARLAAMTGANMLVSGSFRTGAGRYKILADPVPPPAGSKERPNPILWAQAALRQTEAYIRRFPDQWLMPQAVWASG